MFSEDTIASVATGMNASGIGIIRISGPDSFNIISRIFRKKTGISFEELESHRVYYGFIFDGDKMLDEVLVIPMKAPRSYTTEDTVEIDCHGGNLVLSNILKLVVKNGARIADPGEFTKRAFLNGRIDLSEAESVMDLIESKNNLALSNSLKQLTGRLYEKIRTLRQLVLTEIAFIEAALDDPEHISLEGYYEKISEKVDMLTNEIGRLSASFDNGRLIKEGIRTVILGKPNVGKSSLLNYISGAEKAIVTDIPGTTRDIIEENIRLDELSLIVYDTAGIRNSSDPVEKIGVDRARSYANEADLIIFVIDSSCPLDENDREIFEFIKDKKAVILLNKSDLKAFVTKKEISSLNNGNAPLISISVKEGKGFEEFNDIIRSMFLKGDIEYNDEILIMNERHASLLMKAEESLKNVRASIENNMPEDFLSIDLTDCYDLLGMIIGEKTEDDVINEIFARFCVGK